MGKIFFVIWILSMICTCLFAQDYEQWIESSFKYIEENKLDSAEVALKNALNADPGNVKNIFLLNNLGTLQRRQQKYKEALESYSLALNRAPKNSALLSARASLFAELGNFPNALIDYNTLLEENPTNEEALYQRGLLSIERKDFEQAKQDFTKLLELQPQNLFAHLGFATLYKIEGMYAEAENIYNYLEDKEPDYAGIYEGRAELFLLMEKASKALADINKAIKMHPETTDPYLYILRAKAKLLLYEKPSAAEDIQKAVTLGYDRKAANVLLELTK